jgi:hypothetical protein
LSSWVITHAYYKRASDEQSTLFTKLSKEVRNTILADRREGLSVQELNELLDRRTIDRRVQGPFQYIACPCCGSKNLIKKEVRDSDKDEIHIVAHCDKCSWSCETL